jgi:hypothetical protein
MNCSPYISRQDILTLIPTINILWEHSNGNDSLLYIDIYVAWGKFAAGLLWESSNYGD